MSLQASDILEPADKATVHGIVTKLSPVKDGKWNEQKKYFGVTWSTISPLFEQCVFTKSSTGGYWSSIGNQLHL